VGNTTLFGWDISGLNHPGRYGVFVLVLFVLAALAVANLRRSAHGRRLIAIRENERAAASLGVSVTGAKAYAFSIAAVLATLAGIAMGFRNPSVLYENFDPMMSISNAAFAIIGGAGYIIGPLFGGSLAPGGLGSLFNTLLDGIESYLTLIGGIGVIVVLLQNPNGMVEGTLHQGRVLSRWLGITKLRERRAASGPRDRGRLRAWLAGGERPVEIVVGERPERAPARPLELEGLTVRFGGTVALRDASLRVEPGEVVGLIGPNGAGKTTLIDAVTGFVKSSGSITIGGRDISRLTPHRRVAAGVARSWQSLELFEEVSVLENLQVAADTASRRWTDAFTALLRRRPARLDSFAAEAVREFGLEDSLDRRPGDLPYGRRRLVGIARAAALCPGVLLLVEPSAGLSQSESRELGALIRRL
jgi:sulfate-transporting ATPase